MSQTNTNNNNDQNRNHNSGRGGRGQNPGSRGRGDCRNNNGNDLIVKYAFERKMKDGSVFKLIVIETGHRPNQYKKIVDTLPVLCVYKN